MTQKQIQKLADILYPTDTMYTASLKEGFIKGYSQCQEDTEQEINKLKKIMIESSNQAMTWEEKYWQLKNSLNKQD